MTNLALSLYLSMSSFATAMPVCKKLLSSEQGFSRHGAAIERKVTTCWRPRRRELGICQTQVARALGIAPSTFSNRINGTTRYRWTEDDLRNLAFALDVSVDRLLPDNLTLSPSDEPVTEAEVRGSATEASRLRNTRDARRVPTDELIMKAVLEWSLKIRPRD